jgi:hypothetical protein
VVRFNQPWCFAVVFDKFLVFSSEILLDLVFYGEIRLVLVFLQLDPI